MIRCRPLLNLLRHLIRPVADRSPGVLQRWTSPVYWPLAYHHPLLGLAEKT